MTAYTGSGSDVTKLTTIKKAFTVESSKFTVKLQTIFDGGKIGIPIKIMQLLPVRLV